MIRADAQVRPHKTIFLRMLMVIAFAKSFFRYGTCSKTKIPPNPPLSKGGNYKELL